jgi:hypothetical protein
VTVHGSDLAGVSDESRFGVIVPVTDWHGVTTRCCHSAWEPVGGPPSEGMGPLTSGQVGVVTRPFTSEVTWLRQGPTSLSSLRMLGLPGALPRSLAGSWQLPARLSEFHPVAPSHSVAFGGCVVAVPLALHCARS